MLTNRNGLTIKIATTNCINRKLTTKIGQINQQYFFECSIGENKKKF